ncbi:MAG: flagellar basal body-associated FliL family protein [Gammaproteobacteria bacterium]|nr:flagellar basal body-associated FliL family protein [Gammaproteobacteria bacterium]MCF6261502.1 flagellar basal body-associated FliL family protein [Gammaproteobacteria bacterium]
MADDKDKDKNDDDDGKSKGSLVTKILLFGVLPLMTVIILVVGTLFFAGVLSGGGDHAADTTAEDGTGDGEDGGHEDGDHADGDGETLPAIYLPIDPAFVVNFASQGKARFLQVTVEVMSRDPLMSDQITLHMPVIRNNLMLLFSSQSYDGVSTLEGKEALREEALEVVQQILEEETGDPGIEAVYFTSFVMQ